MDSTSDTQTQPLTPKPSKEVGNLGNSSSVTEYPCIPGDETTGIISGAGDNSGATEQNDRPANLYALPLDPLLVGIDTDGIGHVSFSMTSPDVPFFLGQAISQRTSPLPDPQFPVSHSTKTRLLAAYLQEAASWCETTDSDASFTVGSVHSMMESSPFVAAAIALASHQQDSVRGRNRPLTLELYQFAVRLLLRRDSIQTDAHILTTYVSLCVYEMMASDVSEWRRHLKVSQRFAFICRFLRIIHWPILTVILTARSGVCGTLEIACLEWKQCWYCENLFLGICSYR